MDHERIQSDPKVMMGKPVVRGTRIADYPRLTFEDIRAAQAFAADHLARESVFPAE